MEAYQFPQLDVIENEEKQQTFSDIIEEHDAIKTINVFREDKVITTESDELLAQAPKTKNTHFVVPKILD